MKIFTKDALKARGLSLLVGGTLAAGYEFVGKQFPKVAAHPLGAPLVMAAASFLAGAKSKTAGDAAAGAAGYALYTNWRQTGGSVSPGGAAKTTQGVDTGALLEAPYARVGQGTAGTDDAGGDDAGGDDASGDDTGALFAPQTRGDSDVGALSMF